MTTAFYCANCSHEITSDPCIHCENAKLRDELTSIRSLFFQPDKQIDGPLWEAIANALGFPTDAPKYDLHVQDKIEARVTEQRLRADAAEARVVELVQALCGLITYGDNCFCGYPYCAETARCKKARKALSPADRAEREK